jgi:hypothetical protein
LSMRATSLPSTLTVADETRCIKARMRGSIADCV